MKIYRIFIVGFLLIQSFRAFTQGEGVENIYLSQVNSFSRVSLDTLWQYFPDGLVDFESLNEKATWTKANPTFLKDSKGKALLRANISWFQQEFKVPDSLNGKVIALRMGHYGASEIYLDGKLVCRFGDVFASSGKGKSFLPLKPFTATLNNEQTHVITVRYASHDFDKVLQPKVLLGFCLTIAPLSESYLSTNIATYHGYFSMSLYISFTILFFFLYLFYPQRLASLITALYLLNFSLLFSSILIATTTTDASLNSWSNLLWKSAVSMVGGWSLLFIYSVYYQKMPRRFWFIPIIMIVNIYLIINPSNTTPLLSFNNILLTIETWRITLLGLRNKRPGFWILAIGQFSGTLFFVLFIGDLFHLFNSTLNSTFSILQEMGGLLSDLSGPIMFSLHLAWEFSSSNRNLKEQLGEVQKLSKANLEQEKEKQQILADQKDQLENQVEARTAELRASQNQLIQKEKLASLGELTAGIAHEIQNPLNFVNNFSEVSSELIGEMNTELERGDIAEAKEIAIDLKQNLEKINHHGKRASSIVKSMLEHSRTSTGVKELTDINALADEYLRLAYLGIRAKDNSFNSDFKTEFYENLPKIDVIPQDMGRVLLNLINNAFWAVNERSKKGETGYEPKVIVKTSSLSSGEGRGEVYVEIKDNGTGMSDDVISKIFQPFFTTKPTGQGTGLGLSLAYDIVTKGHGGTVEVESVEGEGTTFIVKLPIV